MTSTGERRIIKAYRVDNITSEVPYVEIDGVKHLFSEETQGHWESLRQRPMGEVELLIGAHKAGLLPTVVEKQEVLLVLKSDFGEGYVMFGNHPALKVIEFPDPEPALPKTTGLVFNNEVQSLRQAGCCLTTHRVNKMTITPHKDFMGVEDLGVEPPRRCKKCRGCHDCSFQGQRQTEAEALEYRMLEEGVKHNPKTGRFEVQYAFRGSGKALEQPRPGYQDSRERGEETGP